MSVEQWADLYRDGLPPALKPQRRDERFLLAVERAIGNGWAAKQAAAAVAGDRDYKGARNPVYLALLRLEDIAARVAGTRPQSPRAPEPHGCDDGWIDNPDGTSTTPCPTCRPQLAARLATIPPPGQRSNEDYAYLRRREEA